MKKNILVLLFGAALGASATAGASDLPYTGQDSTGNVAAAFAGAVDSRLGKYIVTDAEYNAYLDWVGANGFE